MDMTGGHEEIDPIKSNPNSHKAIGVVAMLVVLVGLGYFLRGDKRPATAKSPTEACPYMEACPATDSCPPSDTRPDSGKCPMGGAEQTPKTD